MHKSVYYCTSRKTVNKVKLLFIYVIFCFNYQAITSPTVRIACPKLRIYELPNRLIARYKLRIYELQIGESCALNHEFHELQIDELQDKNHEFHELQIVNCML